MDMSEMDQETIAQVDLWRAQEDLEKKRERKERKEERERQRVARKAATAEAEREVEEEVSLEFASVNIGGEEKVEKVEVKFASEDVRGKKKEKKVTFQPLPIDRLPKNWRETYNAKRKKEKEEKMAYKARKEEAKEERKREEAKLVKEMQQKRKTTEQTGSSTPAIRGSTPLNQSAPPISMPDLTKPPPATKTIQGPGTVPAHINIVKEKKIPGLFDIKFDSKTKKLFPIVIPKNVSCVPVAKTVPPPHHPTRFNEPPP